MTIVKLKTKDQKINELLGMFKLPYVDYSNYQVKPGPETLVGGSSAITTNTVEQTRLNAVNELRRWTRLG